MRTLVIGLLLSAAAWAQTDAKLIATAREPFPEFSSSRAIPVAAMIEPGRALEAPKPVAKPQPDTRGWLLLSATAHTAAGFDAWTTRKNVNAGRVEMNPLLKSFANSNGLYPVMQAGPALMDFVGWKMLHSDRPLVRKLWWVPQVASSAISFTCGAKNARNF